MSVLSDTHHRLRGEWSALDSQWHLTRANWSDAVADQFEKEFWQELEDGAETFLRKLELVEETLEQALRALDR